MYGQEIVQTQTASCIRAPSLSVHTAMPSRQLHHTSAHHTNNVATNPLWFCAGRHWWGQRVSPKFL